MTIIIFCLLLFLFLLSVPIAFSIGLTTVVAGVFCGVSLIRLPQAMFASLDSYTLMALPFFILAGKIMEIGGLSQKLVAFANSFLGHIKGGLTVVAIAACMFFAAISGSAIATTVAIGGIMIPIMVKMGYDRNFSTSLIAAGGVIGGIIPPSLPMLVYGVIAGASVGQLFIAGVVPGMLIGFSLVLVSYFVCLKNGYGKTQQEVSLKEIGKAFKDSYLALIMPIIVLGGIYGGFFTATEAAVVAVVYGLIISAFVYKEISFRDMKMILHSTVVTTSVIGLIMAAASFFSLWLTLERIPHTIAEGFNNANFSPLITILIINLFLLILGCFMDAPSATIITVPILLPLVKAIGLDPVHFGIIMVVNLSIGGLTPPLGVQLFVAAQVGKTKFESLLKPVLPFILILIVDLLLISFLPQISSGISSSFLQ